MSDEKRPMIAVFTKNRTNPAYAAARLGADCSARRLGARTVHYVPHSPDDADEQTALIAAALAQRPDAMVLVPVHPTKINPAIRKINGAGVPLIGFINRINEAGALTFVGSEDYPLALSIASHLCERLNARGEVVIIEGPRESITSLERIRGFCDALKQFHDVRIVASICGDYQRERARHAGEILLKSTLRFDAVLAANDVMALGMIDALDAAGRASLIVGVNAIPEAVTAIKQGKLLATIDFDAMKMGCVATEAAIRHLRGEVLPTEIILPVQLVDRSNCEPWDKPFDQRPCPRWDDVVKQQRR